MKVPTIIDWIVLVAGIVMVLLCWFGMSYFPLNVIVGAVGGYIVGRFVSRFYN